MTINRKLRRLLLVSLWVAIGSGVLVLLVAAIGKKNNHTCKGIEIDIRGVGEYYFFDKADVIQVLTGGKKGWIKGRNIQDFNLQSLEATLEKNTWVKDAELFFDNKDVLHVRIHEREPIARIFSAGGLSFYMDSSITRLPLSEKMSVKLPVFTGYPSEELRFRKADSALLQQIKNLSMYIARDSFWNAQVAQIDITAQKTFEIIPVIGRHTIMFGTGDNYERKFQHLLLFYKNVLSKTGMDIYSTIDVQFDGQIVGTKRGTVTKIDSLQALKTVQQLINTNHNN